MKKTTISRFQTGERFCTLEEALNDPYLEDPFHFWVVKGNFIFDNVPFSYSSDITFVGTSKLYPGKYILGAIIGDQCFIKGREFNKSDFQKQFPKLFSLSGKLKNYHTD